MVEDAGDASHSAGELAAPVRDVSKSTFLRQLTFYAALERALGIPGSGRQLEHMGRCCLFAAPRMVQHGFDNSSVRLFDVRRHGRPIAGAVTDVRHWHRVQEAGQQTPLTKLALSG